MTQENMIAIRDVYPTSANDPCHVNSIDVKQAHRTWILNFEA